MTDEQFRLLRQESEHHIRLGSTHQQKRKGGIIHDTTPAEVKHEAGAKVRRSRHGHVHVHDHGEQKGTTRRELTLQHAGREKAVATTATTTTTTTFNEACNINETRQKSLHRKMEKIRYKHQQRSQSRPPSEVVIREEGAPPPPHYHLFLSTPEKVWIRFDHEYPAPRHC